MSEKIKDNDNIFGQKQGLPVYVSNPSIADSVKGTYKKIQTSQETEGLIVHPDTNEIIGQKDAVFFKWQEIDSEQFVKIYLDGIKRAVGLSKTGLLIFEVIYNIMQKKKNEDEISISHFIASKYIPDLNERTYRRGIRELLEREFIFLSPTNNTFFVNINYMFNGDRLAFVKGYQRKKPS